MNFEYKEELPKAEDWLKLRGILNLKGYNRPIDIAQKGLDNSIYGITVYFKGELIGMSRIIGDGYTCFYVQDVLVHPEFQGLGIGKELMNRISNYLDNVDNSAIIGLMSAKGREGFYKKYGFIERPNNELGCGMVRIK